MNKKEIKEYENTFKEMTGLKVINGKEYILSSKFGDIKVRLDLKGDSVFTKLLNPKKEYGSFGFNPFSGKRNYHTKDAIYHFLYSDVVTSDILKSDTAMTAIIEQSIYDKTGKNKMYDISIFKGDEMIESVTCINYMEATRTARNLSATLLQDFR